MAGESKFLVSASPVAAGSQAVPKVEIRVRSAVGQESLRRRLTWAELILGFLFIECAVWAARLSVRSRWAVAASVLIAFLAILDRPLWNRLGFAFPDLKGTVITLGIGAAIAVLILGGTALIGGQIPANPQFPNWHMAWKYVLWALLQQVLLQTFFFARCEELFGSERAVWVAGTLFALSHLPNFILTTCTLFSGLVFCELFRRYRSLYALGVIHAVLGLTLSSTVPESLLQHMRVGIGYLQ